MNYELSTMSKDVRKVLADSFKFYNLLRDIRLFSLKHKGNVVDYYEITPVEIKTMSLFLGILNSDNDVSKTFVKRGINQKQVFNYLGYSDLDANDTDLRKVDHQYDVLNFLEYLNIRNEDLNVELITHLLFSSSNILEEFFYSEISEDKEFFTSEKHRVKEMYESKKMFLNVLIRKIMSEDVFTAK